MEAFAGRARRELLAIGAPHRHGFSNPSAEEALVLGIWAPPAPALAFIRDIGAALTPGAAPDPELMREIYARHASRLLP